jgi:hypothetical protein
VKDVQGIIQLVSFEEKLVEYPAHDFLCSCKYRRDNWYFSKEVTVIARRERDEVVGVLTNGAT